MFAIVKCTILLDLNDIHRFPERPSTPQANPPSGATNTAATGSSNQSTVAGSMQSPRPVNPPTPKDSSTVTGPANPTHRNTGAVGYQTIAGQNQVIIDFQSVFNFGGIKRL